MPEGLINSFMYLLPHMLHFVPRIVKHVVLFSDSCTGQNKNSIVVALFQAVLQETDVATIDHIFLVPGHTRMECDNKHSVIERAKDKVATVDVPEGSLMGNSKS